MHLCFFEKKTSILYKIDLNQSYRHTTYSNSNMWIFISFSSAALIIIVFFINAQLYVIDALCDDSAIDPGSIIARLMGKIEDSPANNSPIDTVKADLPDSIESDISHPPLFEHYVEKMLETAAPRATQEIHEGDLQVVCRYEQQTTTTGIHQTPPSSTQSPPSPPPASSRGFRFRARTLWRLIRGRHARPRVACQ